MDGFDTDPIGKISGTYVYEYVDPLQIRPYWELAKQYVLSDHTFQTQGSGSFTAHQDLIRGGTRIDTSQSLIDFPNGRPWGCDAPAGTVTSLISTTNQYLQYQGPFPCMKYQTLRDLLDAGSISWRYYAPTIGQSFGGDLWNAFDAIAAVRNGPEWSTNVASPETKFLPTSIAIRFPPCRGSSPTTQTPIIPATTPTQVHRGSRKSSTRSEKAPPGTIRQFIIVWDDWGGWYDHVAPPGTHKYGGLGFRVPMIVVSPYAKTAYVSHNQYEFGSIIRFVEDNWHLGRLGTTDVGLGRFRQRLLQFHAAGPEVRSYRNGIFEITLSTRASIKQARRRRVKMTRITDVYQRFARARRLKWNRGANGE